ncbi:MAG: hypothetical protein IID40_08565 [Planctomycetes bacterium]|nr:hypothetical protein [Planctomycetota bacterium]
MTTTRTDLDSLSNNNRAKDRIAASKVYVDVLQRDAAGMSKPGDVEKLDAAADVLLLTTEDIREARATARECYGIVALLRRKAVLDANIAEHQLGATAADEKRREEEAPLQQVPATMEAQRPHRDAIAVHDRVAGDHRELLALYAPQRVPLNAEIVAREEKIAGRTDLFPDGKVPESWLQQVNQADEEATVDEAPVGAADD